MSSTPPSVSRFGPFAFESRRRRLSRDDQPLELSPKAAELLHLLVASRGRVLEKGELLEALWPDTAVQESNLTQTVYLLRRALSDTKEAGEYVQTVPRRGYRFVAEVVEERAAAEPPPVARPSWRWPTAVLALSAVVLALAAAGRGRAVRLSEPAPLTEPRRSVAVLAFHNTAAEPEAAWLGPALSEMLATELGANPGLRPLAGEAVTRTSAEMTLGPDGPLAPETLRGFRERLGADIVVSGAYLRAGQGSERRLRVDLRVQDTASGETVATLSQVGTDEALLPLAAGLGARLRQRMGAWRPEAVRTALKTGLPGDAEALRLYSEGLQRLRAYDAAGAREPLAKAAALDARSPLVQLALSQAWLAVGHERHARETAEDAYRLAEGLSPEARLRIEAHWRAARREWGQAAEIYGALVRLFPDELDHALRLSNALKRAGRAPEALAVVEQARGRGGAAATDPQLDLAEADACIATGDRPRQARAAERALAAARAQGARRIEAAALALLASAYRSAGRGAEAFGAAERARGLFRAMGDGGGEAATLNLMSGVRYGEGRLEDARRLSEECLSLRRSLGHVSGTASALTNLGSILQLQGRAADARPLYAEAILLFQDVGDARGESTARFNIGDILAEAGRLEDARREYEQSLAIERRIGGRAGEAESLLGLAGVALEQGRLDEADSLLDRSERVAREQGQRPLELDARRGRLAVRLARGDVAGARSLAEELVEAHRKSGNEEERLYGEVALADIRRRQGESVAAADLARAARARWEQGGRAARGCEAARVVAEALWQQGQTAEARRVFDRGRTQAWGAGLLLHYADLRVSQAHLEGLAGKAEGRTALADLLAEAQREGWERIALEAALYLGEVELRHDRAAGRTRLAAVEHEASLKGFRLIASQAQAALGRRTASTP